MVKATDLLLVQVLVQSSLPWLGTIAEQQAKPTHRRWHDCQIPCVAFCFLTRYCWIFSLITNRTQKPATALAFCVTEWLSVFARRYKLSIFILETIRQVVKNLCYQTKVNNKDPSPAMKFKALKSSSSKASGTFPDPPENGRWYANSSGEGINLLSFGSG